MTVVRSTTKAAGLTGTTPPEEIARDEAAGLISRVAPSHRREAAEVLHWGYGAACGAAFALLPVRVRRHPWSGPVYGAALWLLLESVISPAFNLWPDRERGTTERLVYLADHLLYGMVLHRLGRNTRRGTHRSG